MSEFKEIRFKPNERALYRKLNKSPFILYPIRETVVQTWHKVSLLVQVKLGGVQLPDEAEANQIRRQFASDERQVVDGMKRLVRCFVDCREADRDATSVRVGLELSRSLAAGGWDGRPPQLLQIPSIGPVGMRKLVSQGVLSVLDLANRDHMDIGRLLSRNPAQGKAMFDTLAKLPRLTLEASAVNEQSEQGDVTTATIKVTLGHQNHKAGNFRDGRVTYATFMAESSGGALAFFWREDLKKLINGSLDLKFPVSICAGEDLVCHFSCEEIVGTIVSRKVTFSLQKGRKILTSRVSKQITGIGSDESYMDDDLEFPGRHYIVGALLSH
jgi:ATP-dependent DNA helicase HFM1/MER3